MFSCQSAMTERSDAFIIHPSPLLPFPVRRASVFAWGAEAMLLVVALLGFAVRILELEKPSLWHDEAMGLSIVGAADSIESLVGLVIRKDIHPFLYYLVLRASEMLAGTGEFSLRFISVLFGMLLIATTYATAKEMFYGGSDAHMASVSVGLAAAALVAFLPFMVRYSREVRGYMMSAALTALALLMLLRATRVGGRWWLAYAIGTVLSWYTHYFSLFVLPAHLIYAALAGRAVFRRWLGATALSVLLFLPWLVAVAAQLGERSDEPDYFSDQLNPLTVVEGLVRIVLPGGVSSWGVGVGLLVAVLGIAIALRRRQEWVAKRTILIALAWIAPVVLTTLIVAVVPKFAQRYLIVAVPPFMLSLTLVLFLCLRRLRRTGQVAYVAITAAAIGLLLGQTTSAAARGELAEGDDPRSLAHFLKARTGPEDALLLVENAPYVFQYYDPGPARMVGLHIGTDLVSSAEVLNQLLATRPRHIWLILWHQTWADPGDFAVTELVRRGQTITVTEDFAGYRVWGFAMLDYSPIVVQPTPKIALDADFGDVASVVGYDLIDHDPGALHVITYWRRLNPGAGPYVATLALEDEQGYRYISATQPLATWYYGPDRWGPDQIVPARLDMPLPPDLPPRSYRAWLLLWDAQANALVTVSRATSPARTRRVQLADIRLAKAQVGGAPLRVPHLANDPFPAGLHLLGYDPDRAHALPGDRLILALWWQAGNQGIRPEKLKLRLLAADGQVGYLDEQPVLPDYPPVSWQPGEVNRAIYTIALPVELGQRDATYALQVGLDEIWATLTEVSVPSLDRRFDLPAAAQPLDVAFGDLARLVGYSLQPTRLTLGQPLTVTLYWRPEARTNESYHVTAQLLVDGEKMAQHDGPPAEGKRPTTSWLPGEVVADVHPIMVPPDLPAGRFEILVALYQGDERLPIGPDRDFVLLPVSP